MNIQLVNLDALPPITSCLGESFILPNGVAILRDGRIVVADSGNNRICLFAKDNSYQKSIGGKGLGKYLFKEPVGVFVSPNDEIFVMDWHNHRVVVYNDSLSYVREFGHYLNYNVNTLGVSRVITLWDFLKNMAYKGTYVPSFFPPSNQVTYRSGCYDIALLISGLRYWIKKFGSFNAALKQVFVDEDAMNKPNGVAFLDDRVIVSQKSANCLSVYENNYPFRLITRRFGPEKNVCFGRLGNIMTDRYGYVYVCDDEKQRVIWRLNRNLELVDRIVGADSGINGFYAFSCCRIIEDDSLLCTCGGRNFQVIDTENKKVVYISDIFGELHGVAYDLRSRKLYIADRSDNLIRVFKISFQYT